MVGSSTMDKESMFVAYYTPALLRTDWKTFAPDMEDVAQEILSEKYDSGNPVSKYVSLRIWYGYWLFRENPSPQNCNLYLNIMENLIRPFSTPCGKINDGIQLTPDHGIFRHTKELKYYDREQRIYHIESTGDECIIIDNSLIPLEKYYISKLEKWRKCLIRCKVCNRLFFADSLRYELCSDECREQMRIDLLALRKKDENISNVDRICTNASAQWYNRLKKIKSSNEYSEEDVKTYSLAKDRFLEKKREKRKAFKKGEITYKELQNWLLHQEVEAQEMLESIQLRKCNES